jgi:hypothetical protein
MAESDDHYPFVVHQFDSNLRVIHCKDHLQWILQKHLSGRWRNVSYHRERSSLFRAISNHGYNPSALQLPALYSGYRRQRSEAPQSHSKAGHSAESAL